MSFARQNTQALWSTMQWRTMCVSLCVRSSKTNHSAGSKAGAQGPGASKPPSCPASHSLCCPSCSCRLPIANTNRHQTRNAQDQHTKVLFEPLPLVCEIIGCIPLLHPKHRQCHPPCDGFSLPPAARMVCGFHSDCGEACHRTYLKAGKGWPLSSIKRFRTRWRSLSSRSW